MPEGHVGTEGRDDARNDACGHDGVAAEFQKRVVDSDLLELQYLGPNSGQSLFYRITRRPIGTVELRPGMAGGRHFGVMPWW